MRKSALALIVATVASGCSQEIVLTGKIAGTRDDKSKGWPGALVEVFDQDGVAYASVYSNANGRFRLKVPRGQTIFVEVGDAAHPVASFTGTSGFTTPLEINLGDEPEIYGVTEEEMEGFRTLLDGCPGLDEGALVIGQAFAFDLEDPVTGENPSMGTVTATVLPLDGEPIEGCYLNETGDAFDPEAEVTGPSGMFAVAGVPPGLHTLIVENHITDSITSQTATSILVDDAAVVPRLPFLMESGLVP